MLKFVSISLPPWGRWQSRSQSDTFCEAKSRVTDEVLAVCTAQNSISSSTVATVPLTFCFAKLNGCLQQAPHGGRLKNAPFRLQNRRSPHPSCLRQSTFSVGEGLNVAALSAQGNEICQTCRGRRPDLLRKLTTRENDWILQENIGIVGIKQLYFLIKIVCLSRVAEDVDPYKIKS